MSGSGKEEIIRSNCRGCHGGCGVLVHVRDGTIVKIEGETLTSLPITAVCVARVWPFNS